MMKKLLSLLLVLSTVLICLASCSDDGTARDEEIEEKVEEDGEYNIVILGDDLMETSKAYEYFEQFCISSGKDVVVDHCTIDDARLYVFAEKCKEDKNFAEMIADAEILIFEEGTSETATTAESLKKILEYANDPLMVNISYYGYPKWFHKDIFEDDFSDMMYADADYYVRKIIASDEDVIGYEHLYHEDRLHPNRLSGYLTAIVMYCEVFDATPEYMSFEGVEYDKGLVSCIPEEWQGREEELWNKLHEMITDNM